MNRYLEEIKIAHIKANEICREMPSEGGLRHYYLHIDGPIDWNEMRNAKRKCKEASDGVLKLLEEYKEFMKK